MTPFTFSIDYSPALGYEYTLVAGQGVVGGTAPNLDTVLAELCNTLYLLGHGNVAIVELETPEVV